MSILMIYILSLSDVNKMHGKFHTQNYTSLPFKNNEEMH